MAARHTTQRMADNRSLHLFRFYFGKFLVWHTVYAANLGEALNELYSFLALSGISDPGDVQIEINGKMAA